MEKLSEIAKEELKTRARGMTYEEMNVVLEEMPVQVIVGHLCCRVNLMQYRLDKMKGFMEDVK